MKLHKLSFVLLTVIYLISSLVRLIINFSTEFMPGANGAFYLANVRSILETGKIFFDDFPLTFWLEALIAKIFVALGLTGFEKSIDLACRLFDSFIPPLAIVPSYFLVKRMIVKTDEKYSYVLFASLSVLFISFLMLVSDFQKNSLGLIWLFGLMLSMHKSLEEKKVTNYIFSFLFLSLEGITHFGSFLVAVLYVIIVLLIKKLVYRKVELKYLLIIGFLFITAYAIIYSFSPPRLKTVFDFLNNMFRNPSIILFLSGKPVLSPVDLLSIALINITAVSATIIFLKNHKSLTASNKVFVLSSIVLSLILAFPFMGIEWSQRLVFMSYVPAITLVVFIFDNVNKVSTRKIFMVITTFIVMLSIAIRFTIPTMSNMNRGMEIELKNIKEKLPKEGSVLLVARHGLEWWVSYLLRMPVVKEAALEKIYWERFKYIIFIIQKKDKAPFGPTGIFGRPFREPILPHGSELMLKGERFDIYWSRIPPADMSIFIEPL